MLGLLAANPLALVVTTNDGIPVGTHAPVLFHSGPKDADIAAVASGDAPLVGSKLVGHMNVHNPQWKSMCAGDRALVVFQGPHGYVSPVVYGRTPAAPTWDFTAVHCTGRLNPTAETNAVLEVVTATARRLESTFGLGWDQNDSHGYFRRLSTGVGAFEVEIDAIETMFKMSQEQAPEERRKVAEHFADSNSTVHRSLAALMRSAENEGTRRLPE